MEKFLTKVEDKVGISLASRRTDRPPSSRTEESDYLSDKPLPSPPKDNTQPARPVIHQPNTSGPKQSVHGDESAYGSDERRTDHVLDELKFDKLGIDDPSQIGGDTQDVPSARSSSEQSFVSSRQFSKNSQPTASVLNSTRDDSGPNNPNLTTRSSTTPWRMSAQDSNEDGRDTVASAADVGAATVKRKSLSPHARMRADKILADSVDTSVVTTHAPAVTHEVRHRHTTEVVHEKITRDIHVDHYQKYIQPFKKVVIKPARHFTLDEEGNKVPIPAPSGWEPPPGFEPTPEDHSDGFTRV